MKATLKICLLFPIVLVFSCSGKKSPTESETPGFEGKIVTGSFTEAARQVISASGGTLSINNPSDPLNGLEITLPADGFSQDQEIIVSEAEITSHQRGTNFNPITPLIKISMGSGYSSDMITVKIPINLPDGHFAMGFFYDETTEKLEPIPVLRLESDFITLMTRHLSPDNATLMKGSLGINKTAVGNMVISSIQESLLDGQAVLSSGFLPGEDDWEFPNYGSYVCPGGHCAGQSMAAMWYYYEKKLGDEPALNARYDELNDPGRPGWFWEDNPRGYRFSSTIQKDQNFDNWVRSLEMQSWLPRISYYSFITAMLLTGEPQYVLIRNSATGSGHAMIVYKITPATGTLHIADPNFPDNMTRVIEYQNGQFKPYSSALVAGGSGTNFDQIGYAAKTSYVEWPLITARWAEFENGTIGDDRFPVYSIWAENGAGHALTDNFSTFDDTLIMHCRSASVPYMIPGTDKYQVFYVYDEQGNPLGSGSPYNNGVLRLHLKMGLNKLGFSIMGANVDAYDNYVDFRWIHVDRLEGNIDFSRVKQVGIAMLSVNTHWTDKDGEELSDKLQSPTWLADVKFSGNVLTGTNTTTGDSIRVSVSGSSVTYYGKTRQTLGSLGISDITISGTVSGSPSAIKDNYFSYEAEGDAACSMVTSLNLDPAGDSVISAGYSCVSNTAFGITFYY